mgnify:CR=1 FL=1
MRIKIRLLLDEKEFTLKLNSNPKDEHEAELVEELGIQDSLNRREIETCVVQLLKWIKETTGYNLNLDLIKMKSCGVIDG